MEEAVGQRAVEPVQLHRLCLPGEGDAVHVPAGIRRQLGQNGGQRVRARRNGQIFIASGSQGQEGGLGALGGNLADVHALGPGFVKAPAHGAAGPGAQGAAGLQLSPGVNMAQGQIL